ncbi:Solute carrier 2 [Mactra antiquata]
MEDEPLIERRHHLQNVSTSRLLDNNGDIDQVDIIARHEPKSDFTGHLALAMAACTLGSSFQFGYNTGIVNAPEKVLKEFYNDTYHRRHTDDYLNCDDDSKENCSILTVLWSVTVSLYCVGGMLGGVSAGYWADKFGRKKTLMLNNILMIISLTIEISSKYLHSYEVLIVGRFFIGINAGM